MKSQYLSEQNNTSSVARLELLTEFNQQFSEYREQGALSFREILLRDGINILFTREYEHAAGVITPGLGGLDISYFKLPHPSGISISGENIFILSTRTPHLLYRFGIVRPSDKQYYYVPEIIRVLPGCLYGHEILCKDELIYINATGVNEIFKIANDFTGNLLDHYRPSFLDKRCTNSMQLNSLCFDLDGEGYSTCFSSVVSDFKPWKDDVGPIEKGAIIRHSDSSVLIAKLTCPHSVRFFDHQLLYCNSGFGEVRMADQDGSNDKVIARLNGFTRGLAISENYLFVGLSKIQSDKRKYAPGLNPIQSLCGISVLCRKSFEVVSTLYWTNGYQIFDVQLIETKYSHNAIFPQNRLSPETPTPAFFEIL